MASSQFGLKVGFLYKGRQDKEGHSSITDRRRSMRTGTKQRRDEEFSKRRGLQGCEPTLEESLSVSTVVEDHVDEIQSNSEAKEKTQQRTTRSAVGKTAKTVETMKAKLQAWRELRKKQHLEEKKKAAGGFVVKKMVHSDANLYTAVKTTEPKKMTKAKSEINFKFVQDGTKNSGNIHIFTGKKQAAPSTAPSKETKPLQRFVKAKSTAVLGRTAGPSKKENKTAPQRKIPTGPSTSIKEDKAAPLRRMPTRANKQEPKTANKQGLHCQLTAAARAKLQDLDGKPREFLRAKSRMLNVGAQAKPGPMKATKSTAGLKSGLTNTATSTKKLCSDVVSSEVDTDVEGNQVDTTTKRSARRSRRSVVTNEIDTDVESNQANTPARSTRKPRKSVAATSEVDTDVESNQVNITTTTPAKSARKSRRSVAVTSEADTDVESNRANTATNTPAKSAKKSRRSVAITSEVDTDVESNQAITTINTPARSARKSQSVAVTSEVDTDVESNQAITRTNTPARSARKSHRSVAVTSDVDTDVESNQAITTTNTPARSARKSRRSVAVTSEVDTDVESNRANTATNTPARSARKSRRSVAITSEVDTDVESNRANTATNTPARSARKSRKSVTATSEVDTDVESNRANTATDTPAKSARKSRKSFAVTSGTGSEDCRANAEATLTSARNLRQQTVVTKSTDSESSRTNTNTPVRSARRPRKSVLVTSEVDTDVESNQANANTPSRSVRKFRRSLAVTVTNEVVAENENSLADDDAMVAVESMDIDRESDQETCKTSARKSCHSDAVTSEVETDTDADNNEARANTPARSVKKSRRSLAVTVTNEDVAEKESNEVYVEASQSGAASKGIDTDSESSQANANTPARKSRRSLAVTNKVDTENEDGQTNTTTNTPAKSARKSRRSVAVISEVDTESDERQAKIINDTLARSARKSRRSLVVTSEVDAESEGSQTNVETTRMSARKLPQSTTNSIDTDSESSQAVEQPRSARKLRRSVAVANETDSGSEGSQASTSSPAKRARKSIAFTKMKDAAEQEVPYSPSGWLAIDVSVMDGVDPGADISQTGTPTSTDTPKPRGARRSLARSARRSSLTRRKSDSRSRRVSASPQASTTPVRRSQGRSTIISVSEEGTTASKGVNGNNVVCATPDLPPRMPVREFKTPFQTPRSAVRAKNSARKQRTQTEPNRNKSPEEMIALLSKSPMVEMSRRRSRHLSSPASVLSFLPLLDEQLKSFSSVSSSANVSASEPMDVETAPSQVECAMETSIEMEAATPAGNIEPTVSAADSIEQTATTNVDMSRPDVESVDPTESETAAIVESELIDVEPSESVMSDAALVQETSDAAIVEPTTSDTCSVEPVRSAEEPVVTSDEGSTKPEAVGASDSGCDTAAADAHVMERVKHFKDLMATETDRLNSLCDIWKNISSTTELSEGIQGQIRTTIGKAQLLIDQRFKQFAGLVHNCEFNLGELKTRPDDLQGFWEMIYFQVEDVGDLFKKLTALKDSDWKQEETELPKKLVVKKKAAAAKPKAKSNFSAFKQEMMARKAALKAAAAETTKPAEASESVEEVQAESVVEEAPAAPVEFDGGFFKVSSPAKTTEKRSSLTVQTNTSSTSAPPQVEVETDNKTQAAASVELDKPATEDLTPKPSDKENCALVTVGGGASPMSSQPRLPFGSPFKRTSYLPAVPSPLLNDITGILPKKL